MCNDTVLNDVIIREQTENSCSVQELISGEDNILVCRELENDEWVFIINIIHKKDQTV